MRKISAISSITVLRHGEIVKFIISRNNYGFFSPGSVN